MRLPALYIIADVQLLAARDILAANFARELLQAGVTLLQYRDKRSAPQTILRNAGLLREIFAGSSATLILNDRADLAALADFDGVHVGQTDLGPDDARRVLEPAGAEFKRIVGVSTHTNEQVRAAGLTSADYIAIGPVFATTSKRNPDPEVGLEGIRRARGLTSKPLVAIGGITRDNARSVIEAGANTVAIISGLFAERESVQHVAEDFLSLLR